MKNIALILIIIFSNACCFAQWSTNSSINSVICNSAIDHYNPKSIPDGKGGTIIVWYNAGNIYAQRINPSGQTQWLTNGVIICNVANNIQIVPSVISDGDGGAIISWDDYRNGHDYDIYAQRINASGLAQWTANGVRLNNDFYDQYSPAITSDGNKGAIITWLDYTVSTLYADIYAQHLDSMGIATWLTNGIAVCTASVDQKYQTIESDGIGGAIITWEDNRLGSYHIYAQRINTFGIAQWLNDGIAICTAANSQLYPVIIADGNSGAIITWHDTRAGGAGDYDIYAQRINGLGVAQWTINGVAICTEVSDQTHPKMVSDGNNGAIITWMDKRNGFDFDIYAQRINSSGNGQWINNGVAVCVAANDQSSPAIASGNSGSAIITWQDIRNNSFYDIYSQRLNSSGAVNGLQTVLWFPMRWIIRLLPRL
ncbi:MAG: hypothetical protein V4677_14270 [Bacteroidota bacterium]